MLHRPLFFMLSIVLNFVFPYKSLLFFAPPSSLFAFVCGKMKKMAEFNLPNL
ncbi:hypothetical protein Scep_012715 [Stephania cephalantha]|uniref:Uncharacterized protein n=1 Tax=Stephania cephalantha TaxID=152367 RepID=A0AAP0JHV4_9MAGN